MKVKQTIFARIFKLLFYLGDHKGINRLEKGEEKINGVQKNKTKFKKKVRKIRQEKDFGLYKLINIGILHICMYVSFIA